MLWLDSNTFNNVVLSRDFVWVYLLRSQFVSVCSDVLDPRRFRFSEARSSFQSKSWIFFVRSINDGLSSGFQLQQCTIILYLECTATSIKAIHTVHTDWLYKWCFNHIDGLVYPNYIIQRETIYTLITTLPVVLALWKTMLHFVTCRGRVLREGRTTFLSLPFTNRVIGRAVIKLRNLWPNPLLPWCYML